MATPKNSKLIKTGTKDCIHNRVKTGVWNPGSTETATDNENTIIGTIKEAVKIADVVFIF